LALTPDASRALSGSEDHTVRLWDVKDGKLLLVLRGHSHRVVAVAISPDGKRGLSADMGPRARLWDLESGKEIDQPLDHPAGVASVAFSPDGKRVLCGLGAGVQADKHSVFRWDAESGAQMGAFRGHTHAVLCVAFSPDGKRMASGSTDESVRVWRDGPETEAVSFSGLKAPVHQVAFSPNGHVLLGTAGAVTHFWNLLTDKTTTKEEPDTDIAAACFTADGRALWVGRADNQLTFRIVPDPEKATAVAANTPPPPRRLPRRETRPAVPDIRALAMAALELDKHVKVKPSAPDWGN
jgi:WD40 repeat protein